jgi:hypothetical protein
MHFRVRTHYTTHLDAIAVRTMQNRRGQYKKQLENGDIGGPSHVHTTIQVRHGRTRGYATRLNARASEWTGGPVAKLCRIASNPDPLTARGGCTVDDEEHEPPWWADLRIDGCIHSAEEASAFHRGQDSASGHSISVRARRG